MPSSSRYRIVCGWRGYPFRTAAPEIAALLLGGVFQMAAEGEAHGGEDLVGIVGEIARAEALVESGSEDVRRHAFVDGGLDGPAAFAGVRDATTEFRKLGIALKCVGGEVKEPGCDDAAAAPDFSDVGQV